MAELAKDRPADAVLSEEGLDDKARLTADRVWIVDPLDGTREFGEPGRTDWAVHVALWERSAPPGTADAGAAAGELTAGAVALPAQAPPSPPLSASRERPDRGEIPPAFRRSAGGISPGPGAQRPLRMVVSRSRAASSWSRT